MRPIAPAVLPAALFCLLSVGAEADTLFGYDSAFVTSYDTETGAHLGEFPVEFHNRARITFGSDRYLYGLSASSEILAYEPDAGTEVNRFDTEFVVNGPIAFGPENKLYGLRVIADTNAGEIVIYDPETGVEDDSFPTDLSPWGSIAFGPVGKLYGLSREIGGTETAGDVLVYDPATGEEVGGFITVFANDTEIAFGPNGFLYGLDEAGNVFAYDPVDGSRRGGFLTTFYRDSPVAFDRDGDLYGLVDVNPNVSSSSVVLAFEPSSGSLRNSFRAGDLAPNGSIAFLPEPSAGALCMCALATIHFLRRRIGRSRGAPEPLTQGTGSAE